MSNFKILKKSQVPLPGHWLVLKKIDMGIIKKDVIDPLSKVEDNNAIVQLFIETCWVMIACFNSFEKHHYFEDIIDDCLEEWKETLCCKEFTLSVELRCDSVYYSMYPSVVLRIKALFQKVILGEVSELSLERLFGVLERELNSAPYRMTEYPVPAPFFNAGFIAGPALPFIVNFTCS